MPRRTTTIVVRLKTPPLSLFATHEADPNFSELSDLQNPA
jgi:hypothetical protein